MLRIAFNILANANRQQAVAGTRPICVVSDRDKYLTGALTLTSSEAFGWRA